MIVASTTRATWNSGRTAESEAGGRAGRGQVPGDETSSQVEPLTPREREILHMLATGAGTREVADSLRISPTTVRNHVQNILRKLEVHSKLEAVAKAFRHGLV